MLLKYISLFSLIAVGSSLNAQQIIDSQLQDPIRQAISSNYELLNKSIEIQKTRTSAEIVRSKQLPDVSASLLYSYFNMSGRLDLPTVNLPIVGIELFQDAQNFNQQGHLGHLGVTGKQIIFSGLQIPNAIKAIEEKANAQGFLLEADKENIAKEVVLIFDQLMLLLEVDKLIIDTEKRLDKESEKVKKAIANGLAIPYDRDKIKLALLELESKKLEVDGGRKLLYEHLALLTHLPLDRLTTINYQLTDIDLLSESYDTSNRKELKALEASQKAYEFLYQKEKGGALPQVFAFGTVGYSNLFQTKFKANNVGDFGDVNLKMNQLALFPNFIVGIGAKWDIFKGNEHKYKLADAKFDLDINENKQKDTKEKLALLLKKNQIEFETAFKKIKVAEQQVKVSLNNMNLATKQYQEGLLNVTERLEAENEYYKASLAYYSQVVQQRKTALELLHSSGTLLHNLLN